MKAKWILLLMLAIPVSGYAQNTAQIRRGTPLYFDHIDESAVITERYQLCEDVVDDTHCIPILNYVKVYSGNGVSTFQFPMPNAVHNGVHLYVVRAFGEGEWSDVSTPPMTYQITGKPLPPQNLRHTNSTPSGTTPPTPPPAVVR